MIVQVVKPFRDRFNYSLLKLAMQMSNPGPKSNYSGSKQGPLKFGFKQQTHAYIKVTVTKFKKRLKRAKW